MGIVLPDGNLNNPSLAWLRRWAEGRAKLLAVVSLPEETFRSSNTTVKASLVFLSKFTDAEVAQWEAAWAQAHAELDARFDDQRNATHSEYSPRIVSGDDADAARLLAELAALGLQRALPPWRRGEAPAYPRQAMPTTQSKPVWLGEVAKEHKTAAAELKKQATTALSAVQKRSDALLSELKTRYKAIDEAHTAALWARVRDLFDQAKRNSPCIIFVDEIDAVGRHRGAGLGGSHDEREQTLNQILVEMDGFETDTNVIVVAATNRPDILDPALLRPGRFDRRVILDRPDWQGRKKILEVHAKGKPMASDVNLEALGKATIGFSGADLENVVNEGAILAARRNQKQVTMLDLEQAIEKVRLGPERRSRIISEEEKEIVAYHEAGHALVAYMIPESDPVHKVSIVARGGAGGFTLFLPSDDTTLISESAFKARLAVGLGGRAAEEIMFPSVTTGASGDLEHITRVARAMVTQYGMSKKLGPITFGDKEELVFLGRQLSEQRNYSEEVAEQIDFEVRRLVDEAHELALKILREHYDTMKLIAERLIEEENLDATAFKELVEGSLASSDEGSDGHSSSEEEETVEEETKTPDSSSSEDSPPRRLPPSAAPLPA